MTTLSRLVPIPAKRAILFVRRLGLRQGLRALRQASTRSAATVAFRLAGRRVSLNVRAETSDWRSFQEVFVDRDLYPPIRCAPRVIIDVGANVGYSVLFFASMFPAASIIAVEPEATNFEAQCEQTRRLPNVECVRAALWPSSCSLAVVDESAEKWSMRMRPALAGEQAIAGFSVDDLAPRERFPSIDLLKIDIEGAEGVLFAQPCPWLSRVKMMSIELHERYSPGCTRMFEQAVAGYGFQEFRRGANRFLVSASRE